MTTEGEKRASWQKKLLYPESFILHEWAHISSLALWDCSPEKRESFSNDGKENGKKTIGLISKTTTLHVQHAFLYISLPSRLDDYEVKMPNFTFYGERKQGTTNFFFLFLNLSLVPKKSTPGKL